MEEKNFLNELMGEAVSFFRGDPRRIQHLMKVHAISRWIAEREGIDSRTQFVLEAAAIVHDVGIKPAEEKFGACSGRLQEQEGPAVARALMERLGAGQETVERVCYLVGHHHTYAGIDGADYQILVEADFLVNFYEDQLDTEVIRPAYERIFRTKAGKWLCREMFALDVQDGSDGIET
ncbi:MAG: HD domain-containing protein [Eubacteriales bacterium]|nr:HD domain-containing protein [Eubacteriales bacterium]